MIPVDVDKILTETGLTPRALAKVTGLKWSKFQTIRKRGAIQNNDAVLFKRKLDEHRLHGAVDADIRNRRGELVNTAQNVKFKPNLPGLDRHIKRSTRSEELDRLGKRIERVFS